LKQQDFWDVSSSKNKGSRTYTITRDNWNIREPRQQQEPRSGGNTNIEYIIEGTTAMTGTPSTADIITTVGN
jgi:hypothetical protein